ncbi:MAG: SRPBCC family protein [Deltaproteobacteria bacterium]|nr:SRPBCC family protein [Deltaproteobacteria bacterium]
MKILRRIVVWAIVALLVLALIATAIGFTYDEGHVVKREAIYTQPPAVVWKVITSFDESHHWRSDVDAVEIESSEPIRFVEMQRTGPIPMEVIEQEPGKKLEIMISEPDLPISGSWTFVLAADEGGTRLSITENAQVRNPLMRFIARTFSDPNETTDTYLIDLGKHLGEQVVPASF